MRVSATPALCEYLISNGLLQFGTVYPKIEYTDDYQDLPEMRWLTKALPKSCVALRSNSLHSQRAAIEAGLGAGLLPIHFARSSDKLKLVPTDYETSSREIWMAMRGTVKGLPRVKIVADHMTELFRTWRSDFEIGSMG